MKWLLIGAFMALLNVGAAQSRTISLDSLSGFNCFDTITIPLEWYTKKVYYPDSILQEDLRFRIWGDGCTPESESKGKCYYRYQRQTFFENGKIQEKEGGYGWYDSKHTKSLYQLMVYNRKGKLMYVEKKKKK